MKIKLVKAIFLIIVLSFFVTEKVNAEACNGRNPDICACLDKSFGSSCIVQSGGVCDLGGLGYSTKVNVGDTGVCRYVGSANGSLCCGAPDHETICIGKKQCDPCTIKTTVTIEGFCMKGSEYGSGLLNCTPLPKGATCSNSESSKLGLDGQSAGYGITNLNTNKSANKTPPVSFTNPLRVNSVEGFLMLVLTKIRQVIVVLALVFIVVGALMYVLSAGDQGMVTNAKGAITSALIGLAIALAAPSFLKEIYTILGGPVNVPGEVQQAATLTQIAMRVLNFLLSLVGVLSILMMVLGGIMYLGSAGNEKALDKGRKMFTYALWGTVMAMSAMVLVKQVARFFQ